MTTLDDLRAMERETISPAVAADVIGCDPHWIRVTARQHPEWLGFPCMIIKSRVKILRRPFIKYMEAGRVDEGTDDEERE